MKRIVYSLIMFVAVLFATNSFAFNVPSHNRHFITDTTGTLSQNQLDQLDSKMEAIDRDKHNQIVALMTASLGGEDIKDVAQQVFDSWRPGYVGKDNGVLILVALNDHKMRIQTGRGVEGDLPDVACWHIIDGTMKPKFRTKDFFGGMNAAIDEINATLESRKTSATEKPIAASNPIPATHERTAETTKSDSESAGIALFLLIAGGLCGIIMLAVFINKRNEEKELRRAEAEMDRRMAALRKSASKQPVIKEVNINSYSDVVSSPTPAPTPIAKPRPAINPAPYLGGVAAVGVVGVAAASISIAEQERRRREKEEQEEGERRARRHREEQDEEDRQRRNREDEERRRRDNDSSSSSSWGGGGGGFDSGGGSSSGGGSDG